MPGRKRKAAGTPSAGATSFGAAMRDCAIKQFGAAGVQTGAEFLDSVHGIPITRNLALQYILGVDVIPLSRCFTIVGNWGSWKSAFGWYIVKLFVEAGGLVYFIDTEFKTNPDQVASILQIDSETFDDHVFPVQAHTLEEMLGRLTHAAKNYIKNKWDAPFLLFVDSMGAVTSKGAVEGMIKDGVVDTGFTGAQDANKVTSQFRGFVPTYLSSNNICLMTINHQKLKIDSHRPGHLAPATTEGGGRGKDFAYTYNIQLKPIGDESTQGYSKRLIRISTKKSALGPSGLHIDVPIYTYKAKPEEGIPMRTVFDWDYALVELLTREKKTFLSADLDAICNVRSKAKGKAHCIMLGIKEKDSVSRAEMGAMIHSNPEMVKGIQDVLGIARKRKTGQSE